MGIRRKTGFAPEMESELVLLLERHRGTLYTVCRSFHPDDIYRMNALYNDIVYNLWKGIRLFRNKKDEAAWVYRLAVNTAINSYNKESRIPEMLPFTQEMEQIPENMVGDPLMEELYALTEQLDSREKMVIDMYLDRIPQAEIASRLSLTESNVSTIIGRIKLKLKKIKDNRQ